MTTLVQSAVVLMVVSGPLAAATQTPSFDVASVKHVDGRGAPPVVVLRPGGRITAPNATLKDLVRVAFAVQADQVLGGPGWVGSDRFEIIANADPTASVEDTRAMLRNLLEQRFQLAAHREMRELSVDVIESTGKPGPQLRRSTGDCRPPSFPAGVPPPPPPPPAVGGPVTLLDAPPPARCRSVSLPGHVSMRSVSTEALRSYLSTQLQRLVIDRTALDGRFDIDLVFTPDRGPILVNGVSISGDAPALSTAMREQLGLKLTSTKESVPVVVIDRAELPTEN